MAVIDMAIYDAISKTDAGAGAASASMVEDIIDAVVDTTTDHDSDVEAVVNDATSVMEDIDEEDVSDLVVTTDNDSDVEAVVNDAASVMEDVDEEDVSDLVVTTIHGANEIDPEMPDLIPNEEEEEKEEEEEEKEEEDIAVEVEADAYVVIHNDSPRSSTSTSLRQPLSTHCLHLTPFSDGPQWLSPTNADTGVLCTTFS